MAKQRIEKIIWYDAADSEEIELTDVELNKTQNFLVKRETYGVILKEDKYGIVILKDKDENGTGEITAIPRGWYERKKPRIIKKKKKRAKK